MDADVSEVTRRRYLDAAVAGDYEGAIGVCRGMIEGGVDLATVVRSLLAPAMWRVGDLWMSGKVTVAQEHRVTAVTEAVVQSLLADSTNSRAQARLLLTGPEGDWHVLPGRMLAVILRQLGWDVLQLTPGLPPDELVTLARAEQGHVAGISCSLPGSLVAAWQSISALREAGFRVVAGGRAFDLYPEVALVLGADAHVRDPLQAHGVLLEWVQQPRPPARPATLSRRWSGLAATWVASGRIVADAGVLAVDMEGVALPGEVLRQDLTLMLATAVAAALVELPSMLADHIRWYADLLVVAGLEPDGAKALLRALNRVLPADAHDVREVMAGVLADDVALGAAPDRLVGGQ